MNVHIHIDKVRTKEKEQQLTDAIRENLETHDSVYIIISRHLPYKDMREWVSCLNGKFKFLKVTRDVFADVIDVTIKLRELE